MTRYTLNGMESIIDDFDSGTGTVTSAILDLNHSQTAAHRKGVVVVNGTFAHSSSTPQYFVYQLRSTNVLTGSWSNTGCTARLESSGTTSSYGWSTTYWQYMNRYQILSSRQIPFTIYLDLRENGTSTPYQRMHFTSECMGYSNQTSGRTRNFWQTSHRVLDNTTVNGIAFFASSSTSFRISATAYALVGNP